MVGQEFATSEVLKTLLVRLEVEVLKWSLRLMCQKNGRALRHFLQHQDSSEAYNWEYSSELRLMHFVCSQEQQTSHWMPRWLVLTGLLHTPQGVNFQLGRQVGPGLASPSPATSSSHGRNTLWTLIPTTYW